MEAKDAIGKQTQFILFFHSSILQNSKSKFLFICMTILKKEIVLNPNREKGQIQSIDEESKLTYEQSADGNKPKFRIKGSDKELFIGTYYAGSSWVDSSLRPSNPCVIRRYDSKDSDVIKYMRDLAALKTKENHHENFIRFFDQVQVGTHT